MSKGVLLINKKEVPIIQVGVTNRVRKMTAADHFTIPAQSECIIDVFLERQEDDDFSCDKDYIIEPIGHFQTEYPLQMASTLVDINQGCTCKVRILNPFPTPMSIKQDAVIGRAEPIADKPVGIVQQENNTEACNFVRVRRVDMRKEESTFRFSEDTARTTHDGKVEEVPEHLMDLYEQATRNLNGLRMSESGKTSNSVPR